MNSVHQFHIPVMGLSFTIDSPVKVARYGIASTVSIIEDKLIEIMRSHYYKERGETYVPITTKEEDYRAKRITDYLNLINRIVYEQFDKLRTSAFDPGSEILKYIEMLPTKSELRLLYTRMLNAVGAERSALQQSLRSKITPGAIDVNIMTKVDKDNYTKDGAAIPDSSDALAALRGYANSELANSSIIFSAGMNPRLFNYLEKLADFNANSDGVFDKKIVIKVSDYRSALIQGKYLAKKGLWVSEFRIESGLNCGGHAFATDGNLLGPILEEFKTKRQELTQALFQLYKPIAETKTGYVFAEPHPIKITVQGGIGTHDEAEFLLRHYSIESLGWGTPFLLCPEATTVDEATLNKLRDAGEEDVILSKNSPLGVRFNYLKGTNGETEKFSRIMKGKPGSPCTEKHLVSNTEFTTEPICTASYTYQKHKLAQLVKLNLSLEEYTKQFSEVVNKECLCVGLSNSAVVKYNLPAMMHMKAVTVCPGPNIAYFNKIVTLQEMTDHIYGRINLLGNNDRPHMFIKELKLNIDYVREKLEELKKGDTKLYKDIHDFCKQLLAGITYYRSLDGEIEDARFNDQLNQFEAEILGLSDTASETVS